MASSAPETVPGPAPAVISTTPIPVLMLRGSAALSPFREARLMERLHAALAPIAHDRAWVRALIHRYLHQVDEPDLAAACPLTLLLPDVARGGPEFRALPKKSGEESDGTITRR